MYLNCFLFFGKMLNKIVCFELCFSNACQFNVMKVFHCVKRLSFELIGEALTDYLRNSWETVTTLVLSRDKHVNTLCLF